MRNAELKRTQQIKRRNTMLMGIGGVAVVLLLILVICISCSSGKAKNKEAQTTMQEVTTVVETTPVVETEPETTPVVMYTTDALNLRKKPNTDADIITVIDAGKSVEVLQQKGKWYQVKFGDDVGYVSKKYLSHKNTFD